MKKVYTLLALAAALCATSCNENEVPFYAAGSDGIYFNYEDENQANFEASVNFADYIVGDSAFLSVPVKLKTLGYLADHDRRVVLKENPVESYQQATIEIPEIIMPAGETELDVVIKVLRPAEINTRYAVRLTIDGNSSESQIGSGGTEKAAFTIYSEETYSQPANWNNVTRFFGTWTLEKHIFLARVTGNDQYTSDPSMGESYNVAAVDSIRTYYAEHPEAEKTIDIPLLAISMWSPYQYAQPPYWNALHDRYLGSYNPTMFGNYCQSYNINTVNEYDEFTGTEDNLREVNKKAVYAMTSYINQQFQMGSSVSNASTGFRVPFLDELFDEYQFAEPYWWVNFPTNTPAGGTPTGIYIDDYYGTYSESKYRFMLKTMLAVRGNDGFSWGDMFPVCDNFMGGLGWDYMLMPADAQQLIRTCHEMFLSEYDKNPDAYDFTFPRTLVFPDDSGSGKDKK